MDASGKEKENRDSLPEQQPCEGTDFGFTVSNEARRVRGEGKLTWEEFREEIEARRKADVNGSPSEDS